MSGERKNGSVVYSLIFLVYASSIACFGLRPGLTGSLDCAFATGTMASTPRSASMAVAGKRRMTTTCWEVSGFGLGHEARLEFFATIRWMAGQSGASFGPADVAGSMARDVE